MAKVEIINNKWRMGLITEEQREECVYDVLFEALMNDEITKHQFCELVRKEVM